MYLVIVMSFIKWLKSVTRGKAGTKGVLDRNRGVTWIEPLYSLSSTNGIAIVSEKGNELSSN